MKILKHHIGDDWTGARTVFEDEYCNRGEVRWPRSHNYGLRDYMKWYDAEVRINNHAEGGADEMGVYAEFAHQLAHVAKTLDLAYADDKAKALEDYAKKESEREIDKEVRAKAQQSRCQEVAQYYMQMVRVQREGHSSNAKGELNLPLSRDNETISNRMWLKEGNGNRWHFAADKVAKFEVKDGNRYVKVDLTPMSELEAKAREELKEHAPS